MYKEHKARQKTRIEAKRSSQLNTHFRELTRQTTDLKIELATVQQLLAKLVSIKLYSYVASPLMHRPSMQACRQVCIKDLYC